LKYTVIPGDSLLGIAQKFGLKSWQTIYFAQENAGFRAKRPNPDVIFGGDVVFVPGGSPGPEPPRKRKYTLALPQYVRGHLESDCWARSLTSFINSMHYSVSPILPEYLTTRYADKTNGGTMLSFDNLRAICRDDWGMKCDYVAGPNFTWDFIYTVLTANTLIYLAYPISPSLAHAVVVYGIGGLESEAYTLFIMDPIYAYREAPLTQFQQKGGLLAGFLDRQGVLSLPGKT
jgi:hypothetical protein